MVMIIVVKKNVHTIDIDVFKIFSESMNIHLLVSNGLENFVSSVVHMRLSTT